MRYRLIDWAEPYIGETAASIIFPIQPVMGAVAGIICTLVAVWWARRIGLVWWKCLLAAGSAALVAQGVARVFWVITVFDKFLENPWILIDPYTGGQTSFGALTGAGIGAALALYAMRAPMLQYADVLAPSGLVGIAIARVGCLLRGCDYGTPSDLPWAVQYPELSSTYRKHLSLHLIDHDATLSAPVHPFPIYLALWCMTCFVLVYLKPNLFGSKPGQRAVGVGLLYLVGRFIWEFWRQPGNAPMVWGPLNAGHAFAGVSFVVLLGLFALVTRYSERLDRPRGRRPAAEQPQ